MSVVYCDLSLRFGSLLIQPRIGRLRYDASSATGSIAETEIIWVSERSTRSISNQYVLIYPENLKFYFQLLLIMKVVIKCLISLSFLCLKIICFIILSLRFSALL